LLCLSNQIHDSTLYSQLIVPSVGVLMYLNFFVYALVSTYVSVLNLGCDLLFEKNRNSIISCFPC